MYSYYFSFTYYHFLSLSHSILIYIGLTCLFFLSLHSSLCSPYPSIFPTTRSFFYSSLLSRTFCLQQISNQIFALLHFDLHSPKYKHTEIYTRKLCVTAHAK
jgi:hypothetical protein